MSLDRTIPPQVHMLGDLALPVPVTETLPNGITLHRIDGGSQEVSQLSIAYPGGHSEARIPAVARMTASMLREGTSSLTGAEISEAVDFNGAIFKAACDSHYTIVDMSTLNSKCAPLMPVLSDILTFPSFPEPAFRSLRDIEANNLMLSQSKVMTLCHQALVAMIAGVGHPHARIPAVSDIESVTTDELRHFYQSVYTVSGCHAYLSGMITDDIYRMTRSMLSALPASDPACALQVVPYHAQAPGYTEVRKDGAVQAAVEIAIPAPPRSHPDYLPLRFTVIGLGGYFGSRLMKNIREDKGYTYGIGAYLLGAKEGSYMLISAQTDAKYVEPLIDEVGAELTRMADELLSDDELMRLRQYSASTLMETLDSPFSIMDYYKTVDCLGLPTGYFQKQVELTRSITPDTIATMAQKYLNPAKMRVAVCR